ncbi:NAD(P)-binding protein [Trametopsis cervina]|nr:NAD(P)-binding protein [Trametopsis cervina]
MSTLLKTSIPTQQRAWLVVKRGHPQQAVVLDEHHSVPSKLAAGEVLVKIQAAALNPIGYKLMGLLPNFIAKRPHVAEHDLAGIVVDANGSGFQNGQEVYGMIAPPLKFSSAQGTLSEYTKLPAECLLLKPEGLKPTEAAGLAYAGLTAYQALFKTLALQEGQSVFINGGSTTVGMYAIQMAKARGCVVTATGSTPKQELLKSLGVDHFIDYTKGLVFEELERNPPQPKYHAILEAVGNADWRLYTHSAAYLAPSGLYASLGPHGSYSEMARLFFEVARPRLFGGTPRKWKWHMVKFNRDDLEAFNQFVAAGEIKPRVDSVYGFEDVQKGYERIMSRRATGKVVIRVDPDAE